MIRLKIIKKIFYKSKLFLISFSVLQNISNLKDLKKSSSLKMMKIFLIFSLFFALVFAQDATCPADDGEFAVNLPHEDCTKFYKCSKGVPVEQDCPIYNNDTGLRLHFNAVESVCDW